MKDFFKKHPELLYTLVAVIIIDVVIVYLFMGDLSETAKAEAKVEQMKVDSNQITASHYAITPENAKRFKDETAKWKKEYDARYKERSAKYLIKNTYDSTLTATRHKTKFRNRVNGMLTDLKGRDATGDKLSFGGYLTQDKDWTVLPEAEKISLFEVLGGVERLISLCQDADLIEMVKIERNGLVFVPDAVNRVKRYKYDITMKVAGSGVKKIMNSITSDQKYFFSLVGFEMHAEKQLEITDEDVVPLTSRVAEKAEGVNRGGTIDDIERLAKNLGDGEEKEDLTVSIAKKNIAPFEDAVITLKLSVDWIQFTGGK